MKNVKKFFLAIIIIAISSICLVNNFVYADEISMDGIVVKHSPLYYIAILLVITIVVVASILILRKINNSNQLQEDEENEVNK